MSYALIQIVIKPTSLTKILAYSVQRVPDHGQFLTALSATVIDSLTSIGSCCNRYFSNNERHSRYVCPHAYNKQDIVLPQTSICAIYCDCSFIQRYDHIFRRFHTLFIFDILQKRSCIVALYLYQSWKLEHSYAI